MVKQLQLLPAEFLWNSGILFKGLWKCHFAGLKFENQILSKFYRKQGHSWYDVADIIFMAPWMN